MFQNLYNASSMLMHVPVISQQRELESEEDEMDQQIWTGKADRWTAPR